MLNFSFNTIFYSWTLVFVWIGILKVISFRCTLYDMGIILFAISLFIISIFLSKGKIGSKKWASIFIVAFWILFGIRHLCNFIYSNYQYLNGYINTKEYPMAIFLININAFFILLPPILLLFILWIQWYKKTR